VQLDGAAPQPLLSADCPGLRHFRVPQHLHWPDALGQAALTVAVTPDALRDMQRACAEFLQAMPRLSVEGVACLTAALLPILRLAALPPAQLQEALDALLHSGRTLMLQVRSEWSAASGAPARCTPGRLAVLPRPLPTMPPCSPLPPPAPAGGAQAVPLGAG
jgi:hypothetical protein